MTSIQSLCNPYITIFPSSQRTTSKQEQDPSLEKVGARAHHPRSWMDLLVVRREEYVI